MDHRTAHRFPAGRGHRIAQARGAFLGLVLGGAFATVLAGPTAVASPEITFWTKCALDVKVASVEVSPVEVLHLTCAQANHAIQRASILLTPGGPIFSTHGYTCSSTNILPRFDPSPIELPATELCTGANHDQMSFIWNYAS
jgi:hypothetical protein